ncbi:unnamed protein product [Caenorhabditis angaria]|uniref:Protein sleepless n=1 Tax=Caenorhabditis angaria TaxID=860376 RepID=A0A9P1ICV5_9PELO|nr:unnamed protein product [Caenorhabditis angaria]
MLLILFTSTLFLNLGNSLICHQCEGWRGAKEQSEKENSCWKLNNNCETSVYCVKITEPMSSSATYEPFKSECWRQNILVVGPGNSTVVENGCYDVIDQAVPPKKWKYCFCDTADYCNSEGHAGIFMVLAIFIFIIDYL